MRETLIGLVVFSMCGTALAHGSVQCNAPPQAEWRPQMELQSKLKSEGWKVRQVKLWNDCYEVYGIDDKGERVEAFFHPKTFERVSEAPDQAAPK